MLRKTKSSVSTVRLAIVGAAGVMVSALLLAPGNAPGSAFGIATGEAGVGEASEARTHHSPSNEGPRRVAVNHVVVRGAIKNQVQVDRSVTPDPMTLPSDPAPAPDDRGGDLPALSSIPERGDAPGGGVAGGMCPGEGSCFDPHGGLGCDNAACCEAVCFFAPDCCSFGWDETCVALAQFTEECAECPDEPEPGCVEFITAGAIYSNWHPECATGSAFVHGEALYADDLWYGTAGGTLQELTFSVFNGAANGVLLSVSLEIVLASTQPGHTYGAGGGFLDLTNAIAILEVELDADDLDGGIEPGTSLLIGLPELGGFDVFLPPPVTHAGVRYVSAEFEGGVGEIGQLGQTLINYPGLGASSDSLFMEGFSASGFFGGDPPARAGWELVTDGDYGTVQVLFDNAPQQEVVVGPDQGNFGWSAGHLSEGSPDVRMAQAFVLPELEGAAGWNITGIFPHGFMPAAAAANNETLNWAIWARDGIEEAPVAGEEIATGSIPYPILHMSHGLNNIGARIHPIPVEGLVLPPGEYYLTVWGEGDGVTFPAHFAWLMNAGNAIKLVDAAGPYMWYTPNYAMTPFGQATSTVEPNACQADPETTWYTMFFIMGEPSDTTPTPCPGDLTGSGSVGVGDLLALLGCWGPVAPGCENADLSDSGSVGVADLLILLGNWGPCP